MLRIDEGHGGEFIYWLFHLFKYLFLLISIESNSYSMYCRIVLTRRPKIFVVRRIILKWRQQVEAIFILFFCLTTPRKNHFWECAHHKYGSCNLNEPGRSKCIYLFWNGMCSAYCKVFFPIQFRIKIKDQSLRSKTSIKDQRSFAGERGGGEGAGRARERRPPLEHRWNGRDPYGQGTVGAR